MQEHNFPDFSMTTLKLPDFSRFSRWVASLRQLYRNNSLKQSS